MIFNELYSAYYIAVTKILQRVLDGDAKEADLVRIIRENAFEESTLTILPALKSGKWQLLKEDLSTPLRHKPTMPLTTIQKQWLKAITLDPRIKLFPVQINGLEEVSPLFTPEDYRIYDKYGDGDPYDNPEYIAHFRTILAALEQNRLLRIKMLTRNGRAASFTVRPRRLEYSEKDDKFRLLCNDRNKRTINLGRILECTVGPFAAALPFVAGEIEKCEVTLKIHNERNTLERCLLHFAHFEKQTTQINARNYLVRICYHREDEAEMVIRILAFGPMVEVVEPAEFRNLILERLIRQKRCEQTEAK